MDNTQAMLGTTLQFVEVASATVKRACDEVGVHRQMQKKAEAKRPAVLDHMLSTGVLAANHKQAGEAMMATHEGTLDLLKAATDRISELTAELNATRAKTLGKGETEKSASAGSGTYDSLSDPMVGRRTSEKKASDYALAKGIQ